MNGGFGPCLGISSSPLHGSGNYSHSARRALGLSRDFGSHWSHTSSRGSARSNRIQPHPSHYGHPRDDSKPGRGPGPVGTIAGNRGNWMVPLCHEPENDLSTCCLGCWCPQILYGRTQYRIRQITQKRDPLNLDDFKGVNGPCASFMVVAFVPYCEWVLIMLQHSRIRAMYKVDGTTADDCCSAYACPNCTLMQDDREIRAREYKDAENEKKSGTVQHQPTPKPDMQYAATNLSRDEPIQHRESLHRDMMPTSFTEQKQNSKRNGSKSILKDGIDNSKAQYEHTTAHQGPESDQNEQKTKQKSKINSSSHDSGTSQNRVTIVAGSEQRERDSIIALRQTWRGRRVPEKMEGSAGQPLANRPHDGTRISENMHPATDRLALFSYSEDASMSQVRGKRVLKQLEKAKFRARQSTSADISEGFTDESVPVYYGDAHHPQLRRLADCARLRASTVGQIDSPQENGPPAGRRKQRTAVGNSSLEGSDLHELAPCPEVVVTEHLKPLDPQHILNDCPAEESNSANDAKLESWKAHCLNGCYRNANSTDGTAQPRVGVDMLDMSGCALDAVLDLTNENSSEQISQHPNCKSSEQDPKSKLVRSSPGNQHVIADCATVKGIQLAEQPAVDQHVLTGCVITNEVQFEAPNEIYSEYDHPGSSQPLEQKESHYVTITVPLSPVIIVTTSDDLKEATREHFEHSRSKSPEVLVMSNNPKISYSQTVGSLNSTRDHDGSSDTTDGQQRLTEAAAALRKVLRAAADARHSKTITEPIGNDPTEANADSSKKISSNKPHGKVLGSKVQK